MKYELIQVFKIIDKSFRPFNYYTRYVAVQTSLDFFIISSCSSTLLSYDYISIAIFYSRDIHIQGERSLHCYYIFRREVGIFEHPYLLTSRQYPYIKIGKISFNIVKGVIYTCCKQYFLKVFLLCQIYSLTVIINIKNIFIIRGYACIFSLLSKVGDI